MLEREENAKMYSMRCSYLHRIRWQHHFYYHKTVSLTGSSLLYHPSPYIDLVSRVGLHPVGRNSRLTYLITGVVYGHCQRTVLSLLKALCPLFQIKTICVMNFTMYLTFIQYTFIQCVCSRI